jgi:RNA polymerase sigma-70 factor (ECF subfamily)
MGNRETGDEELVARSRDGDVAAFDALARRHRDRLFALAYVIVRDAETAADIVQEALLAAWRSLDQLREPAQTAAWLTVITRRIALRQQARRRGQSAALDQWVADLEAAAERDRAAQDDAELRALVRRAVADLPPNLRDPVLLHHFQGLSYAEVCRQLGISLPAVRTRLHRARGRLEESLADALGLPLPDWSVQRRPTMPMLPLEVPTWEIRPLDLPDLAVHIQENHWVRMEEGAVGGFLFLSNLNGDWEDPDYNAMPRRIPWNIRRNRVHQVELSGEPAWEILTQMGWYDGTVVVRSRSYWTVTDEAFIQHVQLTFDDSGVVTQVFYRGEDGSDVVHPRRLKVGEVTPGVPPYRAYRGLRAVELIVGDRRERCIEALSPAEPRDPGQLPGIIRVWYFSEEGRKRLELAYFNAAEPESEDARPAPRRHQFGAEWYLRWVFMATDLMAKRPELAFP